MHTSLYCFASPTLVSGACVVVLVSLLRLLLAIYIYVCVCAGILVDGWGRVGWGGWNGVSGNKCFTVFCRVPQWNVTIDLSSHLTSDLCVAFMRSRSLTTSHVIPPQSQVLELLLPYHHSAFLFAVLLFVKKKKQKQKN